MIQTKTSDSEWSRKSCAFLRTSSPLARPPSTRWKLQTIRRASSVSKGVRKRDLCLAKLSILKQQSSVRHVAEGKFDLQCPSCKLTADLWKHALQNHYSYNTHSCTVAISISTGQIHAHSFVLRTEIGIQCTYTYVNNSQHHRAELDTHILRLSQGFLLCQIGVYIYICCEVIIWSKFGVFGSYYLVQVGFL